MKNYTFNQAFIGLLTLIAVCFTTFGFTTKFGLDSYEIYLNNKLLVKHYVNQPVNLRTLQLAKANDADQLRIIYTHCTVKGAGTGRALSLKDENGTTVKRWSFADAKDSDFSMAIPVKALKQLEKDNANHELSLHYTARELPKGEMLSSLRFK